MKAKSNSDKESLAKELGAEIVTVSAPQKLGGKSIECVKKGSIYIPTGKILIYGAGKVQFPEALREELQQLKAERAGKLGKETQREFARNPKKQKRIKQIEQGPLHNYQRSQGNLQSLLKAGMNPDSLEDAFKIIGHVLEEIGKLGVEMEVGNKVKHVSAIEAPRGKMVIDSHLSVKEGTPPIVYLDTITYSKKK
ncbi:hypothetical protein [Moorena sp. SIO4G3]|uniref:hypothetical protein n=1 Tax=Moorena sp. SIO4G3 TaxID=2607821 RepID=UPI0013C9F76A|nr:hypothetical protein [Moorena sp. SIO4G3]NEO76810.1 hypothetical protein [Moorena sp. SIO4G3]NEO92923.1 hypothetical protein [Moorena sp. SIO3G5]